MKNSRKNLRKNGFFLCLFVSAFVVTSHAYSAESEAVPLKILDGSSEVAFDAVGYPSALKIHGVGKKLNAALTLQGTKVSGSLTFVLESLKTGIELRDHHMKDKYLEIEKFPEAKLEIEPTDLPKGILESKFHAEAIPVKGKLTLHGEPRSVSFPVTIDRTDKKYQVTAQLEKFSLSDYKITTPSFAGITMAKEVNVKIEFTAER